MASKHASKAKRDKKYQPRPAKLDSVNTAIRNNWRATFIAAEISEAKQDELRQKFGEQLDGDNQKQWTLDCKTAVVLLKNGKGGLVEWGQIVEVLNTSMILCERGFGPEYLDALVSAQDQAFAVKLMYDSTNEWGWSDAANDAINEGIDVFAAQLEVTKQADVLSALAEVARRIEEKQVYEEAA